jgi:hypothetical protein
MSAILTSQGYPPSALVRLPKTGRLVRAVFVKWITEGQIGAFNYGGLEFEAPPQPMQFEDRS